MTKNAVGRRHIENHEYLCPLTVYLREVDLTLNKPIPEGGDLTSNKPIPEGG